MAVKRMYRVVLLQWKSKTINEFEIFSNLRILTAKYAQFNYNTLNNYLSKDKIAYENDMVRIERKNIINKITMDSPSSLPRKIIPVVHIQQMRTYDEKQSDLQFWLTQTPAARVAAVTQLIQLSKEKNQRLDKTAVKKIPRRK